MGMTDDQVADEAANGLGFGLQRGANLSANGNQIAGRAYLKQARNTFLEIGANGELQRLPPDEERNA